MAFRSVCSKMVQNEELKKNFPEFPRYWGLQHNIAFIFDGRRGVKANVKEIKGIHSSVQFRDV